MTIPFRAIPWLLASFLAIAAGEPPGPAVVARRGEVSLTADQLRNALAALDPAARALATATPQALSNFTRDRLLNLSVLATAKAKAWDEQPDVVRRIAENRDAVIIQAFLASLLPPDPAYPSEADVTAAYETNKSRLAVPRQFHIAQIVLAVKPNATAQEDEEVRRKALDLRARAARPNTDFAELARRNSQDTQSSDKGGDVGWLREPDMIPAAREAVAGLTENGISQPVRVPDGWHVLKLLGVKPAGTEPLIDAKPRLVAALRQARAQRLVRAYLDDLQRSQPIQVNEIELERLAGGGQ